MRGQRSRAFAEQDLSLAVPQQPSRDIPSSTNIKGEYPNNSIIIIEKGQQTFWRKAHPTMLGPQSRGQTLGGAKGLSLIAQERPTPTHGGWIMINKKETFPFIVKVKALIKDT